MWDYWLIPPFLCHLTSFSFLLTLLLTFLLPFGSSEDCAHFPVLGRFLGGTLARSFLCGGTTSSQRMLWRRGRRFFFRGRGFFLPDWQVLGLVVFLRVSTPKVSWSHKVGLVEGVRGGFPWSPVSGGYGEGCVPGVHELRVPSCGGHGPGHVRPKVRAHEGSASGCRGKCARQKRVALVPKVYPGCWFLSLRVFRS